MIMKKVLAIVSSVLLISGTQAFAAPAATTAAVSAGRSGVKEKRGAGTPESIAASAACSPLRSHG